MGDNVVGLHAKLSVARAGFGTTRETQVGRVCAKTSIGTLGGERGTLGTTLIPEACPRVSTGTDTHCPKHYSTAVSRRQSLHSRAASLQRKAVHRSMVSKDGAVSPGKVAAPSPGI